MDVDRVTVDGRDAVVLRSGATEVVVTVGVGPRIIRFSVGGGPSLLARLGDDGIPLAGGGRFTFYGGHRLWVAPEVPEWSYDPDDRPVTLVDLGPALRFESAPGEVPIRKAMDVSGTGDAVVVRHSIVNVRDTPVDLAPWAITQLTPGGTAFLPLPSAAADPAGKQASRVLVGWPYTRFDDRRFRHDADIVAIAGAGEPTKIGTELQRGWLAYRLGRDVFVKRAPHVAGARYVDKGASGQVYVSDRFVELETLGPAWVLEPGEATTHFERWEMHQFDPEMPASELAAILDGAP